MGNGSHLDYTDLQIFDDKKQFVWTITKSKLLYWLWKKDSINKLACSFLAYTHNHPPQTRITPFIPPSSTTVPLLHVCRHLTTHLNQSYHRPIPPILSNDFPATVCLGCQHTRQSLTWATTNPSHRLSWLPPALVAASRGYSQSADRDHSDCAPHSSG